MTRKVNILLVCAVALFAILYFGFDTIGIKQKDLEKSRLITLESTSVTNLIKDASVKLNANQKSIIEAITLDLEKTGTDTLKKVEILKSLSGAWYELGFLSIAGTYAEEIAKMKKDEESWSLAGTSYALCVKNSGANDKEKEYCSKRSISAFEKAISLNPENIDHKINLAICYVDNPEKDNPMQGILMLRDLNAKFPKNVSVLNQLAQLAIRTNQIDKAIIRLENAIQLEPSNQTTICLLAEAYKAVGDNNRMAEYAKKCKH